ncbi:hypothetical protein Bbelb_082100 [Branchiostoma belcheri]|nr:hypothetical protein Bbelb_082100 [Branchiostoma belcheri]
MDLLEAGEKLGLSGAEREKEAERKHQLEMKKLEAEMAAVGPPTAGQATAKAPRLPAFVDEKDDLDAYLLRGRGTAVKQALLKRYNLTEEGFRAKFRQNKAEEGESPQQFIVRLTSYLERWLELAESSKSYEGLRDLFVKEQFLEACPRDLAVRLREQGPSSLDELAGMAQHYLEAHERELGKKEEEKGKKTVPVRNRTQLGTASGIATCYTCGDPSHFARDCPVSKEARPTGASSFFTSTGEKAGQQATFIVAGQVEGKKVPLLLDTGSTQTLIRGDLVDAGKVAGGQGGITCVHGEVRRYPIARVTIRVGHQSYRVNAKVIQNLPRPAIVGRDIPHLAKLVQLCAAGKLAPYGVKKGRVTSDWREASANRGPALRRYGNGYDRGVTRQRSYNYVGGTPKLQLAARTKPVGSPHLPAPGKSQWRIFGGAKPVDTAARESVIEERRSRQKVGEWRQPYRFVVTHRAGKADANADALSRA